MLPDLKTLLKRAGFTLRGKTRATCAYCTGRDRTTVSVGDDTAYCFRCGWKSGRTKMAREQGLLDPLKITEEDRLQLVLEKRQAQQLKEFESWRNTKIKKVLDRMDLLRKRVRAANRHARRHGENDVVWNVLAAAYHSEVQINAEFDGLMLNKHSRWITTMPDLEKLREDDRKNTYL